MLLALLANYMPAGFRRRLLTWVRPARLNILSACSYSQLPATFLILALSNTLLQLTMISIVSSDKRDFKMTCVAVARRVKNNSRFPQRPVARPVLPGGLIFSSEKSSLIKGEFMPACLMRKEKNKTSPSRENQFSHKKTPNSMKALNSVKYPWERLFRSFTYLC